MSRRRRFGLPANGRRLTNDEIFPQTSPEFGALGSAPPDVSGSMPGHYFYNQGVANRTRELASVSQLVRFDTYWERESVQSQDTTEGVQNVFNLTQFIPNLFQEYDSTNQLGEEIRLTSNGTGPLQWVGGLFATDLHSGYVTVNQNAAFATASACAVPYSGGSCPAGYTYSPTNGGAAANPNGILYNVNNPNTSTQQAIFGEVSYLLQPDLKLTTGLRFYKFDIWNTDYAVGAGTANGNATPTTGSAHGNGSGVLPKVNLSYTPTSDLTVYGTVAKGARPGGVNIPIPLSTSSYYYCGPGSGPNYLNAQQSYYGPDNTWSFELGEKLRFADRRVTVNADVFYVKWMSIQQEFILTCGYSFNTNAGDAKSYGPELEVSAKLTDDLTANLSGAYTQAFINAPAQIPGLVIAPGTRINNIPRYTGSLSLEYDTAIFSDYRAIARVSDSLIGPSQDVAYYRETLSPYALADGRLGVARNAWSAFVFGTNLTNRRAALTIDNTIFAWQQPDLTRVTTNQPRTIGLEFTTKF